MNFYFVKRKSILKKDENQTVWSQSFDSSKELPGQWGSKEDLNTGDIIFHYMKGEIIAISKIKREYWLAHLHGVNLDKVGYYISSNCYELQFPVNIKDVFLLLEPAVAIEDAVFKKKGEKRHLYPCNELLAIKLLELISEHNAKEEQPFTMDLVQVRLEDTFTPLLKEAQTAARQKIEQHQVKFKQALLAISEGKCALCDMPLPSVLRATYSKPWKDCTEQERLDPHNGLLLCCNHSALYEQGYITLSETGKLRISTRLDEQDYLKYGLCFKMQVDCLEGNREYFSWHEKYVFKGD